MAISPKTGLFLAAMHTDEFGFVPDPADRKFAALANAAQLPLVTSDAGLRKAGGQMTVHVLKPSEFAPHWRVRQEDRVILRHVWLRPVACTGLPLSRRASSTDAS